MRVELLEPKVAVKKGSSTASHNIPYFYKFFPTFFELTRKIIYFLDSPHSETVEKVKKICIKWNFSLKNSNFGRAFCLLGL